MDKCKQSKTTGNYVRNSKGKNHEERERIYYRFEDYNDSKVFCDYKF